MTVQTRARTTASPAIRLLQALWTTASIACLVGCVSPKHAVLPAADLALRLQSLSPTVAPAEAAIAADAACSYSLQLAKEYRVVRPAIFHNVLVNLGLRQRGLCFQWADDLSAKLASLHLQTLLVRRGAARLDTRREHSSVVLTALGQPFEDGIVLDAWRHSGHLYWGAVKTDKYPWIEVEVVPEDQTHASACAPGACCHPFRNLPPGMPSASSSPSARKEMQSDIYTMKKSAPVVLCSLLVSLALAAPAEIKPADQKWLDAVQKMVAKGEHTVSTPKEDRANLLKAWGKEHGYTVKIAKTDTGYKIEVTKELAQK
jgi:hypothetical protein